MTTFFREVLARAIVNSASPKTWRLEFPSGLSADFAADIVELTNKLVQREDGSPEAVAFLAGFQAPESTAFVNSEFELVNFRCDAEGERRFLVLNGPSRIESISNASKVLIKGGFPKAEGSHLNLEAVSEAAVSIIRSDIRFAHGGSDWALCQKRLSHALTLLSEILEMDSTNSIKPWNVLWFEFAEASFERIAKVGSLTGCDRLEFSIYPSFGLPEPTHGAQELIGSPSAAAKDILRAYNDWWSSEGEISKSSQFIANRLNDFEIPGRVLLELNLDSYHEAFTSKGDSPVSFLQLVAESIIHQGSLGQYPLGDLLNPRSASKSQGIKTVELSELGPLGVRRNIFTQQPFIVGFGKFGDSVRSEKLQVQLRFIDDAQTEHEPAASFTFDVSEEGCEWVTEEIMFDLSGVSIVGYLEASPSLESKLKDDFVAKTVMSYELLPSDSLSRQLQPTGRTQLLLANGWTESSYLAYFDASKPSPKFVAEEFSPGLLSVGIDSDIASLGIIVKGEEAFFDQSQPFPRSVDSRFLTEVVSISEQVQIQSGENTIQLFKESQSNGTHSPIIAAISKEVLPPIPPSLENANSIRGQFEDLIAKNISNEEWMSCLFHIAVEENFPLGSSDSFNSSLPPGVLCGREVGQVLTNIGFEIDPQFISSSQVSNFIDSVRDLGLGKQLMSQAGKAPVWPSKTSWSYLFSDGDALNRMLVAYEAMVLSAKDDFSANEIFWASYPFSTSIWNAGTMLCSGVMLSPLHPLRLAWLASVEFGLWDAQKARLLSGIVEGWNFPMIGPAPHAGTSMLAVPTDHGTEFQFLGWSMLVPIHSAAQGVVGPNNIGGFNAPGSSSTGLNSSSAVSAVKSYRRVNPQFSSLVIDLASSQGSKSSRLTELDEAIHNIAVSIGRDPLDLPGGIHVLDSLSRLGEFPRERILETAASLSPRPFSWRRYQSTAQASPRCQIRLLQDPGVQVRIEDKNIPNLGTTAEIPFRRFAAIADIDGQSRGVTSLVPRLDACSGWAEFRNAVDVVEARSYGRIISSSLNKPALADGTADWTVSGEGLLSPSSVAALLASSSGPNQMLWEWKPPFLDQSKTNPTVSERAFMTIARVPTSFKIQLESKLRGLNLSAEMATKKSKNILETLGARGMGLAGLLSMGGTHTTGAIGFYAAYKVLENLEKNRNLLVLPVDACDDFLRTLATNSKNLPNKRRADLLAVEVTEDTLRFIPIEVKMYGIDDNTATNQIGVNSKKLDEAKEQVLQSQALLEEVVKTFEDLKSPSTSKGDRALWLTNLAALVDTARKLSPRKTASHDLVAKTMQRITAGQINIELGTPIVNYFTGLVASGGGNQFRAEATEDAATLKQVNVLIAPVDMVFDDELLVDLHGAWKKIAFSAGVGVGVGVGASAPTPEPETTPEPSPGGSNLLPGLSAKMGVDDEGNSHYFHPSDKSVLPQLGVIGVSGAGKTQLMKRVLYDLATGHQDPWPKPGILILDYKGDFSLDQEEEEGFRAAGGFTAIPATNLRLNFWQITESEIANFKGKRDLAIGAKASSFKGMLKKMSPQMGLLQSSHLTKAIRKAYEIADEKNRPFPPMSLIKKCYDNEAKRPDVVSSLFDSVELIELFAEKTEEANNLDEFFATGKRQIINFAPLKAFGDPLLSKFAVSVVLDALVQNMYSSYSAAGDYNAKLNIQRLNQLVFVDEAHNIIPLDLGAINKLLREGRSFGHGLLLATQGMSEFKQTDEDYRNLITQWCLFRVTNPEKDDLAALGFPASDYNKLRSEINGFQTGEAIYRRFQQSSGAQIATSSKLKTSMFLDTQRENDSEVH